MISHRKTRANSGRRDPRLNCLGGIFKKAPVQLPVEPGKALGTSRERFMSRFKALGALSGCRNGTFKAKSIMKTSKNMT